MILYLTSYFYVMFGNTVSESRYFSKMDHKTVQTRDFSEIQKNKSWIYGLILLIAA